MRLWPKNSWAQACLIVGIVLAGLVSMVLIYAWSQRRFFYDFGPSVNLSQSLNAYVARHCGNMPPNWDALREEAVENPSEHYLTFEGKGDDMIIEVRGRWKRSVRDFDVKFGARPGQLRIDGDRIWDDNGSPVTLFSLKNPRTLDLDFFRHMSVNLAKAMIAAEKTAASQPSSAAKM